MANPRSVPGYWSMFYNPQARILADLQRNGQLSVGQAMAVIIVSRFVIMIGSFTIAWAGLKFHIGYTVQNRYSWGG